MTVVMASIWEDGTGHIGIFRDKGEACQRLLQLGCSLHPEKGVVLTKQFFWHIDRSRDLANSARMRGTGQPVYFKEVEVGKV